MFNTTNIKMGSVTSEITLNTPSHGMIQRSHPKSFFVRCQNGSALSKMIFPQDGEASHSHKQIDYPYKKTFVEVIQIMVFGEDWFLVELVKKEDLKDEE